MFDIDKIVESVDNLIRKFYPYSIESHHRKCCNTGNKKSYINDLRL